MNGQKGLILPYFEIVGFLQDPFKLMQLHACVQARKSSRSVGEEVVMLSLDNA